MAYLDTSVLAAYYCPDPLSAAVDKAIAAVDDPVISPLVEVEFCSAVGAKVRTKELSAADASAVLGQFRIHQRDGYCRFVEIGSREYDLARDWLASFTSPLRTLDALHLAAAFANDQWLITADKLVAKSARLFGVRCKLIRA